MLAAVNRLRRRAEFSVAVRTGRRAGRGAIVVHLQAPRADNSTPDRFFEPSRAGFIVPRTVGGAVVRNLVRRRLRHLTRNRLDALPAGTTLVVRALPGAGDRPFHQLEKDLDAALRVARSDRSADRTRDRTRR